jgi:hypothetical protein
MRGKRTKRVSLMRGIVEHGAAKADASHLSMKTIRYIVRRREDFPQRFAELLSTSNVPE